MNKSELEMLKCIYDEQVEEVRKNGPAGAEMDYLTSKFEMLLTLQRQLRVLDMIAGHIRGRVLEWGCHHGLDACVFRMRLGPAVELHSCDVLPESAYKPFRAFSGTTYRRVDHPFRLPYEDGQFDVVLSNGVLEHVPDDASSIREVYRVLKPGGDFVITCLPNRYSYTEAVQRLRKGKYHDRLYTIQSAGTMLRAAGFEVGRTAHFFMLPTMLNGMPHGLKRAYQKGGKVIWILNDIAEKLWPLNRLASNLLLIARKPDPGRT